MAKDPAFLFYPGDWLGGTIGMSFEEKGAYMELLMMQFTRGHMTSHMIGQTVGQLWVKLQDKFVQDDKGLWYNRRLDEEKEKRKNYTGSRKNNLSGTNQHTKKDKVSVGHMTSHMENENVNEDSINNLIEWGKQIVENNDQFWHAMKGRIITRSEMDSFLSVAIRNKWTLNTQSEFRISLHGFKVNGQDKKEPKNKYKVQ